MLFFCRNKEALSSDKALFFNPDLGKGGRDQDVIEVVVFLVMKL